MIVGIDRKYQNSLSLVSFSPLVLLLFWAVFSAFGSALAPLSRSRFEAYESGHGRVDRISRTVDLACRGPRLCRTDGGVKQEVRYVSLEHRPAILDPIFEQRQFFRANEILSDQHPIAHSQTD